MSLLALAAAAALLPPGDIDDGIAFEAFGALAGLETEQASLPANRRDYCALARFALEAQAKAARIERRGWVLLMTDEARGRNGGAGAYRLHASELARVDHAAQTARSKAAAYETSCRGALPADRLRGFESFSAPAPATGPPPGP